MSGKNEIIYPFFLECCVYTSDPYWENIFENLAYGIAPQGTFISKNYLVCTIKDKQFSYKIERKDPEILYNDIYTLLTTKVCLLSVVDKKKTLYFQPTQVWTTWSEIRKKNIKNALIEAYVMKMKNQYNLSIENTRKLFSLIHMGLLLKSILPKDIKLQDNRISEIDGLDLSKDCVNFSKNLYNFCNNKNVHIDNINLPQKISDNWQSFIKNY